MSKETRPLNDTLSLKRQIKTYGFAKPFWDGTREKKVVIQYCRKTQKFQHFPRPTSIFTGRRGDIEWREISGKGEIFSYTVTYRGTDKIPRSRALCGGLRDFRRRGCQSHRQHGELQRRGSQGRHEGEAVLDAA